MSDEPTMRLAAGRSHVVSVCPCAGCTQAREFANRTLTRRMLAMFAPNESLRPLFAPETIAPLHPEWHPSHREIL